METGNRCLEQAEAVDRPSCHNKCFTTIPCAVRFWFSGYLGMPLFWHQSGTSQSGHDVIECGQRGKEQEQGLVGESGE